MPKQRILLIIALFMMSTIVHPVWANDGTLRQIHVPILMYHYVSPLPEDADEIRTDLTVDPSLFEAHMQYLADNGYSPITLYELYDALMTGASLPEKPIVLSFDDGYDDHYEFVFRILRRFEFVGTFFVITGRADQGDAGHLTWEQIAEMAQAGMQMEVHTKTHSSLENQDRDFLIYELLGSRESLAAHTERDPHMLAYPAGRFDALTIRIAEELGFSLAVTTQPGALHDSTRPFELPRLRVSRNTGVAGLAYLLRSS